MSLIARRAIPSVLMGCLVIIVSTQVSGQQRTPGLSHGSTQILTGSLTWTELKSSLRRPPPTPI